MILLAMLNLRRQARRVAGLVLLVVLGTAAGMVATGVASTASRAASDRVIEGTQLRLIELSPADDRTGGRSLTPGSLADVRKIPGVERIEPVVQASMGVGGSGIPSVILYATSHRPSLSPPLVKAVSDRDSVFPLRPDEAVFPDRAEGQDMSKSLGQRVSVDVTKRVAESSGQLVSRSLRVVALYDASWQIDGPAAAYVADSTALNWAGLRTGAGTAQATSVGYQTVSVLVDRADRVDAVTAALHDAGFAAVSLRQQLTQVSNAVGLIRSSGWAILAVVVLVAMIATGSLANTLVRQRVREIGLLKALGYRRRDIFALFTFEMGLVALIAIGAGAALGLAGSLGFGELLQQVPSFKDSLGDALVLPSPKLAVLVAVLPGLALLGATLVPALRAAAVSPSEALQEWR